MSVPTTILGMSDAAVGSKTGVNNKYGKNMIGSFYDPVFIVVCMRFLKTLDDRNWSNGMAEVIKMALILDSELLEKLAKYDIK